MSPISKHEGMTGTMERPGERAEMSSAFSASPPPMESHCGGGAGGGAGCGTIGAGGTDQGRDRNQEQGQLFSSGKNHDHDILSYHRNAVDCSEGVIRVVNRPTANKSPGLNSSHGSHGATRCVNRDIICRLTPSRILIYTHLIMLSHTSSNISSHYYPPLHSLTVYPVFLSPLFPYFVPHLHSMVSHLPSLINITRLQPSIS